MLQINCHGCRNNCCGTNPHLTPVLLPEEEKNFTNNSKKIETPFGDIYVLAKKKNNNCVFLDEDTKRCTIYNKRPLECRLYPFLLDFSQQKAKVKFDQRFCPHLDTLAFDMDKIMAEISQYQFPADWIKKYESLDDC